ncbi:MAG: glycosyltransferase family 4 protein [Ferruginibacter sp.]
MHKLAIITTHPIQYNAPLFRLLAERKQIDIKVFYTWSQSAVGEKYDPGFGQPIKWDIPLLEGYDYSFIENISTSPGSHHYKGINNPTLNKQIEEWGANTILVYGWNFKSHLAVIRFFNKKIPVYFRGDSTLLDENTGLKQFVRRIVLKYIYSKIDKAFYAGVANKAYFKMMGLGEQQLIFMPHAIENERFAPVVENIIAGQKLRKSLDIPEDAVVFLFAGKLEAKKQPDFLIESFVGLKAVNTFLIIAGSGELENSLFKTYAANSFIKFIGFQNQNEMPSVYNCCDVFVLPSKGPNETWGLAINEAMAAGKAIIASDKCGASYDLIVNNKNGFVFKSDNIDSFTTTLKFFVDNPNAAKLMGSASTEMIKEYSFLEDCYAIENGISQLEKESNK